MPAKSITKANPKASKGKINLSKAKKPKITPKKQLAKAKAPAKTHTPSPEPKENSSTTSHSSFVYSPSEPQERLFDLFHNSDPTSEPEEDPVTVENQIEGIVHPCKTQNQQKTTAKPLKEIDNLNAVIDKKWVKAGVAQIALKNLDLPYFSPNNYDKKITVRNIPDINLILTERKSW
ncbi:hypothetical protein DSO57_1017494 [Entomophthora muscae]|uniref:Uncharacterized protein n=1 Tax=Entomophthora muscae TaxID=34485 RepID=A0ACC2TS67_9FUNG|nr:hypothetical protein DSO57_1017494 [Entomophthora muscae]